LKELQPGLAETSQGKVVWKGDALSKILGEEKPGHVHGFKDLFQILIKWLMYPLQSALRM